MSLATSIGRPADPGAPFIAWVDPAMMPYATLVSTCRNYWDFPATVLDKLIPLTPFWETVCDNLKRSDVMLSAGQYVYTPRRSAAYRPAARSARPLSELRLLGRCDVGGGRGLARGMGHG